MDKSSCSYFFCFYKMFFVFLAQNQKKIIFSGGVLLLTQEEVADWSLTAWEVALETVRFTRTGKRSTTPSYVYRTEIFESIVEGCSRVSIPCWCGLEKVEDKDNVFSESSKRGHGGRARAIM